MALTLDNYLLSKNIEPKYTDQYYFEEKQEKIKKELVKDWLAPYETLKHVRPRGESRQGYLSRLYLGYLKSKQENEHQRLYFRNRDTGAIRKVYTKDTARFTEKYRGTTYYKLYNLRHANAVGFLTLTMPAPKDERDWNDFAYDIRFRQFSKKWQLLRSFAWRYGIRFDYFRVFEVTKKGLLHAHVLLYSEKHDLTLYEMEVLANYWHRKIGFCKLIRWTYEGDLQYTWEYFINNNSSNVWRPDFTKTYPKGSNVATNYVMKYQMKELSQMGQAIMTKYRVRTYSYSQTLKGFIRKIQTTGKWDLIGKYMSAIESELDKKQYYENKKNDELSEWKFIRDIPDIPDPQKLFRISKSKGLLIT